MKRSLLVGCISSLAILSGFSSCGKPPVACDGTLMPAAQACADRTSLGFAQEFGSGTFIGSKPQDTVSIKNGGLADLTITSANYSGDSAFTLTTATTSVDPATPPVTIPGNQFFFLRVVFAPTEAKPYSGTITVQSNAQNGATLEIPVSGCGVPTDGGVSSCYRDGGP